MRVVGGLILACKLLLAEQHTLLVEQSHYSYTLLESRERYFPRLMLK